MSFARALVVGVSVLGLTACFAETAPLCPDSDEGVLDEALARPGRWIPASTGPSVRYDDAPAWNGGRNCSGTFTAGAAELRSFLRGRFPQISSIQGYSCRQNTANLAQTSVHGTGRALDIFIPLSRGDADNDRGDPVANWLVANAAEIGVQYIVWDRTSWGGHRAPPRHRSYSGPHPHHDHLHVELNHDAANRRTPFFRRCTPHCEGDRIVNADCGVGNCGAYAATCVDDSLGVRCASVFCPARGEKKFCWDGETIATCRNGSIGMGDCSAYGATCVDDALGARCASVFCPPRGETKFCFDDRRIATCRNGAISIGDCGAYGASCVDDDLGARCASVFCPPRGETRICLDDRTLATCRDGAISTGDCGAYAAMCSTAGSDHARCVSVFCAGGPEEAPVAHDVCLPNGQLAHCNTNGIPEDARDCEAGTHCQAGGSGGVGCFAGGSPPEGVVDLASCDEIAGWARDADAVEAPIDVFLGLDGEPGVAPTVTIEASEHRDDLCDQPGGCAHGFRVPTPLSLFDGTERVVHVYGGNVLGGGHRPLDGSPVTLRCDLTLPAGVLRPIGPDAWTSFGLSAARDQLPGSATASASTAVADQTIGTAWPGAIELVRVEGQAWLVDGEHRRRVDATSFAGFRFQDHLVAEISPEELGQLMVGPDLPPRPIVVERDGQLYMVDIEPNGVGADGGAPGGPEGGSLAGDPNALRGTSCAASGTSPSKAGSSAPFLLLFAFVCIARLARRRRPRGTAKSVLGSLPRHGLPSPTPQSTRSRP